MINRLNFYLKLFVSLIFLLNSIILRKLIKFFNLQKFFFYPQSIYQLIKSIDLNKKINTSNYNKSITQIFLKKKNLNKKKLKIKILNKYYNFKNSFSWQIDNKDIEAKCALGRWHWLLDNHLSKQKFLNYDEGILLVASWISKCKNDKISNYPYEISERITNFIHFISFHKKKNSEIPDEIRNYLDQIVFKLANNVEFNDGDLSGNHIANNARGLIAYGTYFNSDTYINLGKEVIVYILPKLIKNNFFLREASSHYQYLFTSWIFEIYIFLYSSKNKKTIYFIKKYLSNLINGCMFFKTGKKNEFVLIGDVSPDKTPHWLENITSLYLKVSRKKNLYKFGGGWASMISKTYNLKKINFDIIKNEFDDFCFFRKAGFLRLKKFKWLIFKHIENDTDLFMASHGHHDFTSFVAYYDNNEILIDPGRLNYTNTMEGKYGKSAKAHNTITINGYAPSLSRSDRHIPKEYKKRKYNISFENKKKSFKINLSHNGFKRAQYKINQHKREILIYKNSINILDSIYGQGMIKLNSYLHFPKSVKINNKFNTKFKGFNLNFLFNIKSKNFNSLLNEKEYTGSINPFLGWRFPNYGVKLPITTKVLNGNFELPIKLNKKLSIKSKS